MSDAGWHPDPHGRAERRYHDGTRWTEHVADAEGDASVDPQGGGATPVSPVIGPPPPRPSSAPSPAPDPDHTHQISAAALPPPPADPIEDPRDVGDPAPGPGPGPGPGTVTSPSRAEPPTDHTQQLSAADLAAATSSSRAEPPTDHTVQMSAEEVAAAAALARSAPPAPGAGGTRHTEPLSPADIAAAAALAAAGDDGPAPAAAPDRAPTRPSVIGLALAALGVLVGLGALFVLAWADGPGSEISYLDLREVVDASGPDIGSLLSAYVLTGALFALGIGGVVALARAIGAGPVRALGAAVVVLGVGGLAVLGFIAIDTERPPPGPAATAGVGADVGAPVTLPDGTPVTDPTSGDPVTVREEDAGTSGLSDEDIADALLVMGEDRLTDAAAVGAGLMVVSGLLMLVGLFLRGTAGHVVTALGLLVAAGWSAVAVWTLRDQTELGDVGLGAYAVVASAVLLAVSAAVPGRRRSPDAAP
jgi:hypothetical protein